VATLVGSGCLALRHFFLHDGETGHQTVAGILMMAAGLNLLGALTAGAQALFDEQLEERRVHRYKCTACNMRLGLSDLPPRSGEQFCCRFCERQILIFWEGDYGKLVALPKRQSL
jgi:hypothetical protein